MNTNILPPIIHLYGRAQGEATRLREKARQMREQEARHPAKPGQVRQSIAHLLYLSRAEAERQYWEGRIPEADYRCFLAVWKWSTYRLSVDAQEAFIARYGFPAFKARINKVRAACGFGPMK